MTPEQDKAVELANKTGVMPKVHDYGFRDEGGTWNMQMGCVPSEVREAIATMQAMVDDWKRIADSHFENMKLLAARVAELEKALAIASQYTSLMDNDDVQIIVRALPVDAAMKGQQP